MHILYSGDSPTVTTGFGIVAQNLLKRFVEMGHKVTVLGINFYGEPYDRNIYPYDIWPCDKGATDAIFGIQKLWWIEKQVKPDLIFFLNDPWIVNQFLEARPEGTKPPHQKIVAYYPIDSGPLKSKWAKTLTDSVDIQVCYSHFAESIVEDANKGRPKNLRQIYHGVDTKTFFPVNQSIARAQLQLPQDDFIVGMVARNQFRKRFDILAKAFAKFSENKPNTRLYLHTAVKDIGFDIGDLARQLNIQGKLVLTEDLSPAKGVPETVLNLIYNSFDINCLLSLGDGFGLPVAESMATGCVQLVSNHSCLRELVEGHGGLTVDTAAWIMHTNGINTWGGVPDEADLTNKLNLLYNNKDLRVRLAQEGFNFIKQERFNWDFIANQFQGIFKQLFHLL